MKEKTATRKKLSEVEERLRNQDKPDSHLIGFRNALLWVLDNE